MTIKKLSLSVIAATALASSAFAGTVSITGGGSVGLIGSEYLSLQDANVTGVFDNISYAPSDIPATSLKNPIFKFSFANAKNIVADANVSVYQVLDGNDTNITSGNLQQVAKSPQVSGTNSNIISFNAVDATTYAYNSKKYVLGDSNTTGDYNATAGVKLQVTQGSTSDLTLQAELYSGDSQAQADLASPVSIAKVGNEYVGSIVRKFDATIDASNSFYTFYNNNSDTGSTKKADDLNFLLQRKQTLPGATLGAVDAYYELTFDQNLTKNAYNQSSTNSFTLTPQDLNVTAVKTGLFSPATPSAIDKNETIELTVDGTSKIEKTNFDLYAYVKSGTTKFPLITKTIGNAGAWTIYGYNAQIPNVSAIAGGNDTTLKFTNRSSLDNIGVYFTLIDPDGTMVTVDSVNDGLSTIAKNATGKYKASALAALAAAKDVNFDASTTVSIEVSIPTTPSSVYGMASMRNTAGNFKELPVYNSSKMAY